MENITFSTKYLKYTISADARNIGFSSHGGDERIISGPCAVITADDRSVIPAVKASYDGGILSIVFADGTEADIAVSENDEYLTFTMSRLSREDFLSISFVNITLDDASSEFVGTLIGMTLSPI